MVALRSYPVAGGRIDRAGEGEDKNQRVVADHFERRAVASIREAVAMRSLRWSFVAPRNPMPMVSTDKLGSDRGGGTS
jgi:hypothetical protein